MSRIDTLLHLEKKIAIASDANGEKLFLVYAKLQVASSVYIFCHHCLFKILLTSISTSFRQCESDVNMNFIENNMQQK